MKRRDENNNHGMDVNTTRSVFVLSRSFVYESDKTSL